MSNKYNIFKCPLFLIGLFVFLCNCSLRAQTVSTYYGFAPDIQYPRNLVADQNGNFYFIIYDANWQVQIAKLSAQGVVTIILSGNYNPQYLASDAGGNLYFVDAYNWPYSIKKITAGGVISDIVDDQAYYPQNLSIDNEGSLYFTDAMNWPTDIKKVAPDGTVSVFVTGNYNPGNIVFDAAGNLYFTDDYNWPPEIKKVTPDGTVSSFVSGNYYPQNLAIDSDGNLFFLDGNWPPEIKKVTADGTVSTFVNTGIQNANSLTTDQYGNVYFINQLNGQFTISMVKSINSPCNKPAAPVSNDTVVCSGSNITLRASGIGEISWYDEALGGNLMGTGSYFTPPLLNSNTSYYAAASLCDSSSVRTQVTVTVIELPTLVISGNTTGNDHVTLTASGGNAYLWTGGVSNNTPTNVFTKSGTVAVTVTNAGGCSAVAFATLTVNKFGLTKFGQLTTDTLVKMDKNGQHNTSTYINKHGKSASAIPVDGLSNYQVFRNAGGYANNAGEFTNFTLPANQTSAGAADGAVLLDWTSWNVLTNAGIAVPNNGEQFSVQVSGYFIPEESGTYLFTCEGDDAVDLFINNVNVANHYGAHGTAGLGSHTGTINLLQGIKYSFRARMEENGGGEGLRVFWRKPSENSGWHIYSSEITSF